MSKGFNKVVLMGNLTKDPDTRTTPSGSSVTNFTLAVTRKFGDKEETSFINCVVWAQAGEIVAKYATKGSPLLVSGRLDQRLYEDKDGNKRNVVEVIVEDFNFIGGNKPEDRKPLGDSLPSDEDFDRPVDLSAIPF